MNAAMSDAPAETELRIEGMTCAACVQRVERSLSRVPGVRTAAVNLATHRAQVVTDSLVDPAALVAAVEATGFGATTSVCSTRSKGCSLGFRSSFSCPRTTTSRSTTSILPRTV